MVGPGGGGSSDRVELARFDDPAGGFDGLEVEVPLADRFRGPGGYYGFAIRMARKRTAPGSAKGPISTNWRLENVEVVLDPPWDQSMMSDGARLQLGLM